MKSFVVRDVALSPDLALGGSGAVSEDHTTCVKGHMRKSEVFLIMEYSQNMCKTCSR